MPLQLIWTEEPIRTREVTRGGRRTIITETYPMGRPKQWAKIEFATMPEPGDHSVMVMWSVEDTGPVPPRDDD